MKYVVESLSVKFKEEVRLSARQKLICSINPRLQGYNVSQFSKKKKASRQEGGAVKGTIWTISQSNIDNAENLGG